MVGVSTTSTPVGAGTARFAASSVTSAPRFRASSASATPIRPEERFPTKRTESSGSRVPPAVTSTRFPASVSDSPRSSRTRAKIASGSLIRPIPSSPSASSPVSGPISSTPRARSVSTFPRVAGCSHIRTFIAGATRNGPRNASASWVSTLSASPFASFASVFAESGAITSRSASTRWG